MQITDLIAQMGGVQSMARELGISEEEAARGADALAPAILGGFKKQAQPTGIEGLGGLLGQLGGGGLLDDVLGPQPTNVSRGNDVLGHIFGSKEVSRTVAQRAATQTGLDPAVLKKMLPMLAMLVGGLLAKKQGAGSPVGSAGTGGLGGVLGGLVGGLTGRGGPGAGSHGLASMLDLDGDGNPLDDILRMVGQGKR